VLQRGARYSVIANDGVMLSIRSGKDIRIVFDYVGVARHSDRHQIEAWLVTLVRICRQLTGLRLPTSRVTLTHLRHGDISEFKTFFGGDIVFGAAADEIAFPLSIREIPVVSSDPYLNGLLTRYCEEALAGRRSNRGPFGLIVENAIAQLLPHGRARAAEIARRLGVSQRTLVRRLASEGLTFAGILQDLRSNLAARHLRDETLPISKIAWLLGYQDVSAFTHAFKRWSGTTPRMARQRRS
jgi:AraC-like DNA-binding protein